MTILLFLFGVAVAAGLFFILADILKLPRLSTEKALLSAGRAEKKRMKSLDAIFLGWAIKLSKFIRMDEYKRHRMERTLSAAGMDMTPEVYLAYTILKPAAALLVVIPCLLIFPLLSPIVVLLSILLYFKESRKAEEKVTERREKIEGELPRFVATVEQELGASRDVLTILENYKRHAGPDFARELDVLTADMRSSSYEAALVRFEGRLASPMLSDIVRDRVFISTVHKAKGLEFDNVIVTSVIDGTYPFFKNHDKADILEDARKLYVAISRTKRTLVLTMPAANAWNYAQRPSRFLESISTYFEKSSA